MLNWKLTLYTVGGNYPFSDISDEQKYLLKVNAILMNLDTIDFIPELQIAQ